MILLFEIPMHMKLVNHQIFRSWQTNGLI